MTTTHYPLLLQLPAAPFIMHRQQPQIHVVIQIREIRDIRGIREIRDIRSARHVLYETCYTKRVIHGVNT